MSSGVATDAGGDLDQSIVWSDPIKSSTGIDGTSTVEKAVYRRVTPEQYKAIDADWEEGDAFPSIPKPTGGAYVWTSSGNYFDDDGSTDYDALSSPWVSSQNSIVGDSGDVWSSVYTFSIEGDTGVDVADGQWSEPVPQIDLSVISNGAFARIFTAADPDGDADTPDNPKLLSIGGTSLWDAEVEVLNDFIINTGDDIELNAGDDVDISADENIKIEAVDYIDIVSEDNIYLTAEGKIDRSRNSMPNLVNRSPSPSNPSAFSMNTSTLYASENCD